VAHFSVSRSREAFRPGLPGDANFFAAPAEESAHDTAWDRGKTARAGVNLIGTAIA
jgi:hypothetical protein